MNGFGMVGDGRRESSPAAGLEFPHRYDCVLTEMSELERKLLRRHQVRCVTGSGG